MNQHDFIRRGGGWVVAQIFLMLVALVSAPWFRGQWPGAWPMILGGVLIAIGGWFGIAAVRALGRSRTPYPKPLADATLVQHGIYRLVRHPLYSSLMLVTAGWALLWWSWAGLAAASTLTLLLHAKAMREERWLRERYPEYRAYEQRVKRFVPGLW